MVDHAISAFHAGRSLLLRPRKSYDGLSRTLEFTAAMAGDHIVVSDGHTQVTMEGHGGEHLLAFHTAGSTGTPKCVIYSADVACAHARAIDRSLGLSAERSYVALAPSQFAYGLSIAHSHSHAGVSVRFAPAEWGLREAVEATADAGSVGLYILPQHVPLVLSAPWAHPGRIHQILVAGGPVTQAGVRALARRFPSLDEFVNMYGQAELGPRLSLWRGHPDDFVAGTVGHPLPGVSITAGHDAETHRPGPVLARSVFAMSRRIVSPYREVETTTPGTWIDTGDLGTMDHGILRLHARADHVVTVAGTQVDLQAVGALTQRVFAPLAVRTGHRETPRGTRAVLEFVPDGPAPTRREVRKALHDEIGPIAAMVDVHVVDQLSLSESGK